MHADAIATEIRAAIAALPRRNTPSMRAVRKDWSTRLRPAPAAEVIAIAQALERDARQEDKWVAYELIRFHPEAFDAVSEAQVAEFAGRIASWYATDAFGTILSGPLWAKGRISDDLIDGWSRHPQMWFRRSALVATVGLNASLPGKCGDPGRTLPICLRLAGDREDMIEKAVSWALRYLSQKDRDAVVAFMDEHGGKFAARVRRELRNKLTTGLKSGRA
ncbi:DNA alkylation repair protein [uncultured Phenylobacterium sp.]|uniref:DNA alkylation repair protein n=1 Tax=uncultured Phenylobacterium sp. TaxID=349273 RepID=UPI0025F858D3|nr:DNA alkylation repair protein [uncultured Phenylobacterium sp.]